MWRYVYAWANPWACCACWGFGTEQSMFIYRVHPVGRWSLGSRCLALWNTRNSPTLPVEQSRFDVAPGSLHLVCDTATSPPDREPLPAAAHACHGGYARVHGMMPPSGGQPTSNAHATRATVPASTLRRHTRACHQRGRRSVRSSLRNVTTPLPKIR